MVKTLLPLQGARVQSLVRELRSHAAQVDKKMFSMLSVKKLHYLIKEVLWHENVMFMALSSEKFHSLLSLWP